MPRVLVCSFSKLVVFAAVLAVAASAQSRSRISQRIEDTEPVVFSAPHPLARAEFDRGRVEGSMRINRAAMVFKLAPAQQAALEKLLAEQQNPHSPNYHKWLTPEQYASRFGMSEADLSQVSAWLKSQGLTVNGYSRARTRLFFSGTASQVESAFHTEFHRYLVNGETPFANATELSVPQALSSVLLGFRGLENFRPLPRAHAVKANFTSHVTGNHFVSPGDFATIYNLKPLYDAGFDGTGVKIVVVGQTQILTADIDAFRSAAGLPATNLQLVPIDSSTGFSTGDEVESDLDVEWTSGVAKNAAILFVYAGASSLTKNVFDALEFAIDNNLAPVISTSYGNCEAHLTGFTATLRSDVQQANVQGQTVMAASGDAGAADCESQTAQSATQGLAVDAPGSIPEVTAMGGTEFSGDAAGAVTGTAPNTTAGATAFWGGTDATSDNLSSALSYIPEVGWNDTALSIMNSGGLSASGGGVSAVFAKPSWQTALTPADSHRDVPDISLTSSPNHDSSLICSQALFGTTPTSCSAGFRASDGSLGAVGGTSVASPAFAGIVAILNQATQSSGLGNINPTLYSLAVSTPTAFHDITTGDNIVPCTTGSTGCPSSHTIGYSAGAGYDLVTGLGSVNANVLVTSWPSFVATPDFSLGGSPISVLGPGQSGTSTITVSPTNGFTGTVALACSGLPAGATCAFVPPSLASGTSTLTVTTSAATPIASSSITVTGTSGSLSHATSVSLTVSAPPTPDFTIAAGALSSATVVAGASSTSTITIAPTAGSTGTVTLACGVAGGGTPAPTCALAPASVANSSGTSVLTIKTTASHSLSGRVISPQPGRGFGWLAASSSGLFAGIFLLGVPLRRRRMTGLALMLVVFFAAGVGCGGGSSSGGGSSARTPAGSYTITVTATSGALSHTANLALTVQ
ncbi:MAG TPA: protease pro-enzyme activation domain-containing protein [Terriglobales bacterium]|nr:protease pro-enzyme activation domain-containing protein [Terriglobales bacterium]